MTSTETPATPEEFDAVAHAAQLERDTGISVDGVPIEPDIAEMLWGSE